jgi:hypothetical protein
MCFSRLYATFPRRCMKMRQGTHSRPSLQILHARRRASNDISANQPTRRLCDFSDVLNAVPAFQLEPYEQLNGCEFSCP